MSAALTPSTNTDKGGEGRMSMEHAVCRGCGRRLQGDPFYRGKLAYIPETGERAKVNHYGGYVCSHQCDKRSSLELERSMPGHGSDQTRLGCYAYASLKENWPEFYA